MRLSLKVCCFFSLFLSVFVVISWCAGQTCVTVLSQQAHNVETTSIQCWFNVKTLNRRCFNLVWSLGMLKCYADWVHLVDFCCIFTKLTICYSLLAFLYTMPASVAQLDAPSDWRPGGRGFNPRRGRQHSFVEIDHEIFSTVILSLPLIQEGQLSVSGERMCTILVNRLED